MRSPVLPLWSFLCELALRNAPLYYFGWVCLVGALACAGLGQVSQRRVLGTNAWRKPLRFCMSITLFVWTMGWYLGYLGPQPAVAVYSWVVVAALAAELLWITGQAARGQRSHFNVSTSFNARLAATMGVVIIGMTLWTAYLGVLFCQAPLSGLPPAYAWAIRLGIGLFVVFAGEGGLIVARGGPVEGRPAGGPSFRLLGRRLPYGDLRVAHFIGMHALQVLPLVAWYGELSVRSIAVVSLLYGGLAAAVLVVALQSRASRRSHPAADAPQQG